MKLPRTVRLVQGQGLKHAAAAGEPRVSPDAVVQSFADQHGSYASLSALDQDSPTSSGHAADVVDLLNWRWWGPSRPSTQFSIGSTNASGSHQSTPRFGGGMRSKESGRQHGRFRQPQQQQRQEQQSDGSTASDGHLRATAAVATGKSGAHNRGVVLPMPTPAMHMPSTHFKSEAEAVQELPGIGTWAGRYRLFGRRRSLEHPPAPDAGGLFAKQPVQQAEQALQQPPGELPPSSPLVTPEQPPLCEESPEAGPSSTLDSDDALEVAWRWRFTRKWEAEQQKNYADGGPEPGTSYVSTDGLEALEYTQACGVGTHMQFLNSAGRLGRSQSGGPGALARAVSGMSMGLQDMEASLHSLGGLSEEVSPGNSTHGGALLRRGSGSVHGGTALRGSGGRGAPLPDATAGVLRVASKARDLLQKQEAIEEAAAALWEASVSASEAWAGRELVPVQIDLWGRYPYVVIRVSDGPGHHQRFLVRGRNGVAQLASLEEVQRQVADVRRKQQLPPVMVELVGRGTMEWREDTGRHLLISSAPDSLTHLPGAAGTGGGDGSSTKGPMLDLGGLAASLVRQALPCHFQISTSSAAAARSGGAISGVAARAGLRY